MVKRTHLWIEDTIETDGKAIASVTIEENVKPERSCLWYSVPAEHRSALTKSCDPFVLGTLFKAMRESTDLVVHGEVSPSLLHNVDEFQEAWTCWLPQRYNKIDIIAEVEREQPKAEPPGAAVLAFSGGVDSCFTAWRHSTGRCGRQKQDIRAGLMVHGFDIPLDQSDVFERAAEKSEAMLTSLGIRLIPIATNFKAFRQNWVDAEGARNWVDAHGAGVASCLMMLQGGFVAGLIASSSPYHALNLPWGSNPITDWMMSSNAFRIIHDGASYIRREKIREIAGWPEALRFLRVCYSGAHHDRNCGCCEKCIRTILSFRVMRLGLPECFERDVSDKQILSLRNLGGARLYYLEEILSVAKAASISESWVGALEKCVKRNRRTANGITGLWHRARKNIAFRSRLRRLA